jgi:hypothetical protein
MLRRALYSKTLRVSFILIEYSIEYSARADSKRLPCIGTPGIETHRVDMRSFNQYRHTPLTASNFGMVTRRSNVLVSKSGCTAIVRQRHGEPSTRFPLLRRFPGSQLHRHQAVRRQLKRPLVSAYCRSAVKMFGGGLSGRDRPGKAELRGQQALHSPAMTPVATSCSAPSR